MPKRPGQHDKSADPDVLPIVKCGIAMLLCPIQRRSGFRMREGRTVIAAKDQTVSEDAMADEERTGQRLRVRGGQEVAGVLEGGRTSPAGLATGPKPEEHGEMERSSNCSGLSHQ